MFEVRKLESLGRIILSTAEPSLAHNSFLETVAQI